MPTKTDNGIKSVPPTVSNPDTLPSSVEASPSSALRGTAEAPDGNAVAADPDLLDALRAALTARLVCPQCGRKPPKRNIPPFSKCCGRTWREDSK